MTMLAGSLAILLIAQSADFIALTTLDGLDLRDAGIDAQVIRRPNAMSVDAFAEKVVHAEQLKAWDGNPMVENKIPGPLGYKSLTQSDGRSVVVYYSRGANGPKVVCRLRTKGATGLSDARYRALRWCAGQVGVELPTSAAPPVGPSN